MRRYIVVNDSGRRIGETHHRTRLSDQAVDQIRQLRDQGESYGKLSRKFGVGKSTVRDICTCRIRAQLMVRVKRCEDVPAPLLKLGALDLPPMAEIYAPDDWPAPRPGPTVAELGLPPLNTEESGQRAMRLVCWAVLKDPQ